MAARAGGRRQPAAYLPTDAAYTTTPIPTERRSGTRRAVRDGPHRFPGRARGQSVEADRRTRRTRRRLRGSRAVVSTTLFTTGAAHAPIAACRDRFPFRPHARPCRADRGAEPDESAATALECARAADGVHAQDVARRYTARLVHDARTRLV